MKIYLILIKNLFVFVLLEILYLSILIRPDLITRFGHTSKTIDNVVRFFSLLLLVFGIIAIWPVLVDSINYLFKGNNYIRSKVCEVKWVNKSVWFFFAQQVINCKDGDSFVDRFTTKIYSPGEIVNVKYLPRSKLIVDTEILKR
jgi:hypothetical protein